MAKSTKSWTHKIVRRSRGMDGKYFDFPTTATFVSEADAMACAETFARELSVGGTYISVRRRGGKCIAEYHVVTGRPPRFADFR